MQKVKIYSDGACTGNPDGPGGYGTLLQYVDKENSQPVIKQPPITEWN